MFEEFDFFVDGYKVERDGVIRWKEGFRGWGKLKDKSKDELKPKKKTKITKEESGGGLKPKSKKNVLRK